MKASTILLIILLTGLHAYAQQTSTEPLICDCPDCRAKAASGAEGFSLPGLSGLNEESAAREPEIAESNHYDHDHAEHDHAEHEDAEHGDDLDQAEQGEHEHDDHEHDLAAASVAVRDDVAQEIGIQVSEAGGGTVAKSTVFPAEIKLNRDRSAAVSPRYASVVRQVFAEIGDAVRKGDVLATLENRETLAVYTVAAPLDGVVISKDLAVGETANADKVLYEVADLTSVWADISIFPRYQHLVEKGMKVEFIAHDGHVARGVVKYISPIVSHETRTFTARCVLEGAGEDFTPGAFVQARINIMTVNVAVRVEHDAVQSIAGEKVVFIPADDGYAPVVVETGWSDAHHIEIRHGLTAGDRYVSDGSFTLKAELITSGMDPHAGHSH